MVGFSPSPPLVLYLTYSSIVEQILLLHSFTKTPSASFVSLSPSLSPFPHPFPLLTQKKFGSLSLCLFFFPLGFFAKNMQNYGKKGDYGSVGFRSALKRGIKWEARLRGNPPV